MDAINYQGLKAIGTNKIDSTIKGDNLNILQDGLSEQELNAIDHDKDGVITEEEFKQAYGASDNSYKDVWNSYINALSSGSSKAKTDKDGNRVITQQINGNTVTSTYDKTTGELIAYSTSVISTNGKTEVKNYSVDQTTGQHVLEETITKNKSGVAESSVKTADNGALVTTKYAKDGKTIESITTTNPNDTTLVQLFDASGKQTGYKQITVDGTEISRNNNGNVTAVSYKTMGSNGKQTTEKISYNYDTNGEISSITINGKKYTGEQITIKDGKITIKDNKKTVFVQKKNSENEEIFYIYDKNGKIDSKLECNSDGYANSVYTYDDNGKCADRTYCDTGRYRVYNRDKNGKLATSYDYDKQGGRLLTKQTYFDQTNNDIYANNDSALWATRTFYDKNGNETKYYVYDYERQADDTVNLTLKQYSDSSKKTLQKTTEYLKDSYANTLQTEVYNAKNELQKTTTITYKDEMNELKTKADISTKTIVDNKTNQTTIETYDCTQLMSKDVLGKYKETYTYHSSGVAATVLNETADGKDKTLTTYRNDGTKETETLWKNHTIHSNIIHNNKQFDAKGNLELETNYEYFDEETSNLRLKEVKTTDGKGNIRNQKTYSEFGVLNKEIDNYSNGASTEKEYNITYSSNETAKITNKDKDGNVTGETKTLFEIIKEKHPELIDSIIKDICSFVRLANNGINNDTLFDENSIKGLNLNCYKIENGIASPKK